MKEIMRSNYSREERQKIVEEYIQADIAKVEECIKVLL